MSKLITFFIIFGIFIGGALNAGAQDSGNPVAMLSAYYEAINGKQYKRAYAFWRSPEESLENFSEGYADTEKVRLIVEAPASIEGAAGSLYAAVPTVLISTKKNGAEKMYSGCYTLQKSNLRPPDIPKADTWHIYRANLQAVSPTEAKIPQLLDKACAEKASVKGEKTGSRVLGVIGDETEAISVPAAVQANKDFEITVTTNGSGCVSAGDTGVVLGETAADVFVYDFTTANRPGVACTMIFKSLPHKVTLRFTKTGEAVVRVWARKQGGSAPLGEPVVIERRVAVK